jgi:hypothetical protein
VTYRNYVNKFVKQINEEQFSVEGRLPFRMFFGDQDQETTL